MLLQQNWHKKWAVSVSVQYSVLCRQYQLFSCGCYCNVS
uniref:Uncharacterized protein n=1 Tax=Rhizophora mucronata TaxID=61149 RepID=A0A2P2NTJ1_RHIMU